MTTAHSVRLNLNPDTKDWPPTHYVFLEKIGSFAENAPQVWGELHQIIPAIAAHNTITGYMSLYRMEQSLYRAGVSLAGPPQQLPAGVRYENYPGGRFHRFVLTGPYPQLGEATCLAFERVRELHLPLRDDFNIENYVNDPRVTPEDQLLTEILFPAG